MQTTLNKIKSHSPCEDGWKKLLNYLNKTEADDEVLELRTILESNGLDDTIWVFRAVEEKDKEIRLFAADCAELVLPIYEKQYPNDDRPRKAIQAARDYANELISAEELDAARDAAWDAALAAAWDAARDAAVAAWAAAWDAARDAAVAAWAAARAAAADAARAASVAAMAAWAAARAAEGDASAAARAAEGDAVRNEIKSLLLKYI
jgi:hypothetical protein